MAKTTKVQHDGRSRIERAETGNKVDNAGEEDATEPVAAGSRLSRGSQPAESRANVQPKMDKGKKVERRPQVIVELRKSSF